MRRIGRRARTAALDDADLREVPQNLGINGTDVLVLDPSVDGLPELEVVRRDGVEGNAAALHERGFGNWGGGAGSGPPYRRLATLVPGPPCA
jgi:hypothetical protein